MISDSARCDYGVNNILIAQDCKLWPKIDIHFRSWSKRILCLQEFQFSPRFIDEQWKLLTSMKGKSTRVFCAAFRRVSNSCVHFFCEAWSFTERERKKSEERKSKWRDNVVEWVQNARKIRIFTDRISPLNRLKVTTKYLCDSFACEDALFHFLDDGRLFLEVTHFCLSHERRALTSTNEWKLRFGTQNSIIKKILFYFLFLSLRVSCLLLVAYQWEKVKRRRRAMFSARPSRVQKFPLFNGAPIFIIHSKIFYILNLYFILLSATTEIKVHFFYRRQRKSSLALAFLVGTMNSSSIFSSWVALSLFPLGYSHCEQNNLESW